MSITIEKYYFEGNGRVPNSRLPLLVYRKAIRWDVLEMEAILRQNNWNTSWRAHEGMWPRHHFHSEGHEFICVTRGTHTAKFGGHNGGNAMVSAGDILVIPAGVGHCGLQISDDLDLSGGFYSGMDVGDFRIGDPNEYEELSRRAREIPIVDYDPVFGAAGPLSRIWRDADMGIRRIEPETYDAALLSQLI